MSDTDKDRRSEAETVRIRDAALKRALSTPPKPHKPTGEGKKKPVRQDQRAARR